MSFPLRASNIHAWWGQRERVEHRQRRTHRRVPSRHNALAGGDWTQVASYYYWADFPIPQTSQDGAV